MRVDAYYFSLRYRAKTSARRRYQQIPIGKFDRDIAAGSGYQSSIPQTPAVRDDIIARLPVRHTPAGCQMVFISQYAAISSKLCACAANQAWRSRSGST